MTKEQLSNLKKEDKIRHPRVGLIHPMKVDKIDLEEGIIYTQGGAHLRYENCELVEEDKLVEYLNNRPLLAYSHEIAQEIRKIVREEVVNDLKFPTYNEFIDYYRVNSLKETYEWLTNKIKELNR